MNQPELHRNDLQNATVPQLLNLAWTYTDPTTRERIAAELEDRGLDPYA